MAVLAGGHVVLISVVLKKDQTSNTLQHLELSGEALDPGENHHPVEVLILDRSKERPQVHLLLFTQTIDDAFIAVSLNDFVQPIQDDSLFVHYQEHDFHIAIYHASIAGKRIRFKPENTCRTVKSLWQNPLTRST